MAIRNFVKYLAAAAFVAVACQVQEPLSEPQAPASTEPAASDDDFKSVISVQFDDALAAAVEEALANGSVVPTKAPGMSSMMEELGIESMERVFPDAGEFEPRSRKMGMHRFYTVKFTKDVPVTKAAADFSGVPGVISAHPPRKIYKRSFSAPNDPYFNRQWHYVSSNGADINVKGVWEKYTTGSNSVIVCVVDEPIDPSHADLKDNLWMDAEGHTGYNFARNSWDLTIRPAGGDGDIGHGTHVGGTISAVSNNGVGVAGIAGGDYASGVQGVLLQSSAIFSGTSYATDANTAKAVKWGAEHGAVISQNSWGLVADYNQDGKVTASELESFRAMTIDDDPALKAAVDYFIQYAGCDADGNQLPDSPMKGGLVLFAAGNEGYLGVDWDPYAAYEPVIAVGAFRETGASAYYSNYGTWIDVAAPGGYGTSSSNSIWSTLPVSNYISSSGYGGTDWAGTSMACPHVSGVAALIVSYFGGQGFTADDAKDILFGGLGNVIGGSKPVGRKIDALASFEYGIAKYGEPGGSTPDKSNESPVITLSPSALTLKAHESAVVSVEVSDPDGDPFECVLEDAGSGAVTFDQSTMTLRVTASREPRGGSFKAVVKVTDQPLRGGASPLSATATLEYTILPNHAPVATGWIEDKFQQSLNPFILSLANLFRDEDGETLHYTQTVEDTSVASAEISGGNVVLYPVAYGVTRVKVNALDGLGESASISFKVAFSDPQNPVTVTEGNVSDTLVLGIDSETITDVTITVYNASGATVLRTVCSTSAFDLINLDVSSLAPGRYTAVLKYGGKSVTVKFNKY